MQSLYRGSFCAQDGEKPGEGSGGNPARAPTSIRRDVRRETWRDPWYFSPYLRLVYHKALSGTYQKIYWSAQKVLASTYRRIFG